MCVTIIHLFLPIIMVIRSIACIFSVEVVARVMADEVPVQGMPRGMITESLSPSAPQLVRFNWNTTFHDTTMISQAKAPSADLTTYFRISVWPTKSSRKNASLKNQTALTAHRNGRRKKPPMKYFRQRSTFSSSRTLRRSMFFVALTHFTDTKLLLLSSLIQSLYRSGNINVGPFLESDS